MFKRLTSFTLLILIIFSISIYSQNKKENNYYEDMLDEAILDFVYSSRPMIELNYGIGYPGHTNVTTDFAAVGNWDLKLGKSERKIYKGILLDLNERYAFGSYMGTSLQNYKESVGQINTTVYRWGFGSRDGIGYGGSFLSVTPYVSQDFVWTKLNEISDSLMPASGGEPSNNYDVLKDYQDAFRFGDKSSYGIKLELGSSIQLNPYYETSVVYRRHLFWYWGGSFLVSQIGYNILSRFTDEIVENSPVLGPIVNFALKAGYLYGYYLLRQENMNWPFNPNGNEPALTFETINIGVSIVF